MRRLVSVSAGMAMVGLGLVAHAQATGATPAPSTGVAEEPAMVVLRLETEVGALGDPRERMRVYNGEVRIGRWDLRPLPALRARAGAQPYLVRIPLTLHLQTEGRVVRDLQLDVHLDTPEAVAVHLFPSDVERTEPPLTFTISEDLAFVRAPAAGLVPHMTLERVRPRLKALGSGQPRFAWVFTAPGDRGVEAGDYDVFFTLTVPEGTPRLEGNVSAESHVGSEFLGLWQENTTRRDGGYFAVDLRPRAATSGARGE